MRLFAFINAEGQPSLGGRVGPNEYVDLTSRGFPSTLDEVLEQGPDGLNRVKLALATGDRRQPLNRVRYLPPLSRPSKAFAIGLNYVDHATESKVEPPSHPVIFQRYSSSWVAHGEALHRPKTSVQFDYEAEIVAVIGKPGRSIPKERALDHVAGYALFNDGSIRDHQFRTSQWFMGKNFDRTGGFGPEFVSADELPAGAAGLRIQCRLNGEVMQDANTRDMIFDIATVVAACSEGIELQSGDMIISGTPSGVGMARKPPVWLRHGDVVEVEVENVGVLRNSVVDD